MYGFTEDKSKWNLGNWFSFTIKRKDFIPGISSNDPVVAEKFPEKYVAKYNLIIADSLKRVCGEVKNPCLIWDIGHKDSDGQYGYGLEDLTDAEQEDAAIIEDVFVQNECIYITAKEQPLDTVLIRIKGA